MINSTIWLSYYFSYAKIFVLFFRWFASTLYVLTTLSMVIYTASLGGVGNGRQLDWRLLGRATLWTFLLVMPRCYVIVVCCFRYICARWGSVRLCDVKLCCSVCCMNMWSVLPVELRVMYHWSWEHDECAAGRSRYIIRGAHRLGIRASVQTVAA